MTFPFVGLRTSLFVGICQFLAEGAATWTDSHGLSRDGGAELSVDEKTAKRLRGQNSFEEWERATYVGNDEDLTPVWLAGKVRLAWGDDMVVEGERRGSPKFRIYSCGEISGGRQNSESRALVR